MLLNQNPHQHLGWTYQIHTFGCKVNTYDTSLLEQQFKTIHLLPSAHTYADIHIFNTCAVTQEAIKKAQKQIRKLKLHNPESKIIVTGCGAQVDTDQFTDLKGVDLVVANSHKSQIKEYIPLLMRGQLSQRIFKSNIFKKQDMEFGGGLKSGRTRAFLKIQDGCNSFCTYCVIPFARGKSRSLSVNLLCDRINQWIDEGICEVVLTGVHIGDYHYQDMQGRSFALSDLLQSVLEKTSIPRIRLTSLEPLELTNGLMELYQDSRVCPHFHLSIQSASNPTLQKMRRQYTSEDVQNALLMIEQKLPDAFVGMDVIVGFTGESQEDFHQTYTRLEDLPWNFIHVFPYSVRPGTRASKWIDDVPLSEKKQRSQKLRELSQTRYFKKASEQVGCQKKVLPLKKQKNIQKLLSRDYWKCILTEDTMCKDVHGDREFEVKITGHQFLAGDVFLLASKV